MKIIVILGPTGVGKTKLSVMLAKHFKAVILNADSIQVYQELNIGTAKIKEQEKENIPHYLFDIKNINEYYNIYQYQQDVRKLLAKFTASNQNVILVGGTGLYIKSALYNYQFMAENNHNNYDNYSTSELVHELKKLDPTIHIDCNNRRRVIRALDYFKAHHQSINSNQAGQQLLYDNTYFIGLTTSRKKLYEIIDQRVDKMIAEGLILEAKKFYDASKYSKPLINGIGYKELYPYFKGEISLEESIDLIKKNSRHYAKRQYTYFNHQLPVTWFETNFANFKSTFDEVVNYIETK